MAAAALILLSVPSQVRAQQSSNVAPLLRSAKALRASGDTTSALAHLRQALSIAPNNPTVICEMALTYEAMGLASKAATQWERLVAMGNSTPYLTLAQEHLRPKPIEEESQLDGFSPGSFLRLMELSLQRSSTDQLTLKIPIKARQSIDAGEVVIQVVFFDLLTDAEVAQTKADVSHRFITPPVDWREEGIEILKAEYSLSAERKSGRKYFGYLVTLYYKNILQDQKAEPKKLLEMYPPLLQLDTDSQ